jgi:hypothetical protein
MEKVTLKAAVLGLLLISTSVFSQSGNDFNGQLLYHNNNPIVGANAFLYNAGGDLVATTTTDIQGLYLFENLTAGDYTVSFSTAQPAGGVELSDAFLVMLRIMNLYTFNSVQALAADVNGSGTITWTDYFLILIGYLNQGNPFPVGPWVFETASVTIPLASRDGFTSRGGSSSGDVNGNLQPDPKSNPIFINTPVIDVTKNMADPVEFNLAAGENLQIAGMHLAISIPDELEVVRVESLLNQASIFISDGKVKVTWIDESLEGIEFKEGDPILTIITKANETSRGGSSYSLKLGDESHLINGEGEMISGASLTLPTIYLTWQNKNINHTVYPNPFINYATVEYQLLQDGHVNISLFDQAGRQVIELENSAGTAGIHQVKIDGSSLLPGIYYYHIRLSGNEQHIMTGSIIKSK